jgi:hypothetical protein
MAFKRGASFVRNLQTSWEEFDVELLFYDNEGSTGNAMQGAVEFWFSPQPVNAMIGCSWSSLTMPVAALGHTMQQVQMDYGASNVKLSNKQIYSYFLRTFPPDSLQGLAMVGLVQYLGYKRVSWIYEMEAYAEGVYRAFLEHQNGTIFVANAEPMAHQRAEFEQELWIGPTQRIMNGAEKIILISMASTAKYIELALKIGFFTADRLLITCSAFVQISKTTCRKKGELAFEVPWV